MMIDFTADWCVPCQELAKKTYPDPQVQAALARFISVRIDATDISGPEDEVMNRFGVVGLPTIVFIDSKDHPLETPRLTGFIEPAALVRVLARVH